MYYKINLGHQGDADCALKINDKEYGVESRAWNLISIMNFHTDLNTQKNREHQSFLEYIYNNFDEDLINKPVETTNEQLPTNLKIKLMETMSKHIDLRNSDNLVNKDLYHSFLDWEKEMWKLIV